MLQIYWKKKENCLKVFLLVFFYCFVKRQKSSPQNQNGQVVSVCIWDVDFKQIKRFSTIKQIRTVEMFLINDNLVSQLFEEYVVEHLHFICQACCNILMVAFKQSYWRKKTWCLTSTETIRLIRDGDKGEEGIGDGEEGDYIPIAMLSPPEWFLH